MQYDAVIRNGMIVDGTGAPAYKADLALHDGGIAVIGRPVSGGRLEVNAAGCVVSPGFIDAHNHADHGILGEPGVHNFLTQGITTSVTGNCGLSLTPILPEHRDEAARYLTPFTGQAPEYDWSWSDLDSFFDRVERLPLGQNLAVMAGHGTLRIAVMGFEEREPTEREMERMRTLLRREFDCGAAGLSFGLYYPPGNFSKSREMIPLMRMAAEYGRRCTFHLRSESDGLLQAVDEVLFMAEESGASVSVSHHKAVGRANWGKVAESLRTLERARRAGIDVVCDCYPYTAGSTTITSLFPTWTVEGGIDGLLARLRSPDRRAAIRDEIIGNRMSIDNHLRGQPWEDILIGDCPENRAFEGKSLRGMLGHNAATPESMDAFMDWLAEIRGNALMVCLNLQSEDDLRAVLFSPLSAVVSDGWIAPWGKGRPHPRAYGSIPRFLGRYVRDGGLMRLEEGVRKVTSMPAVRYGLTGRGILAEGMAADIAVWEPETIIDCADYLNPHQYSKGIHWVFVNGTAALAEGTPTGAAAGRILRKSP